MRKQKQRLPKDANFPRREQTTQNNIYNRTYKNSKQQTHKQLYHHHIVTVMKATDNEQRKRNVIYVRNQIRHVVLEKRYGMQKHHITYYVRYVENPVSGVVDLSQKRPWNGNCVVNNAPNVKRMMTRWHAVDVANQKQKLNFQPILQKETNE